jgi:predicted TIM-barrel fold metal-dependent hydrolase
MGFDGLKVIEGKPSVRKEIGRSFLGPEFAGAFAYLEAHNIPILWHIADPEESWDREKCSEYAIEAGWCYDSPEYLSKEATIAEALQILDRYPKLNVTFAHFMFTSFNIKYAEWMMEEYPNICFDITPGIEMYMGFDSSREQWKDFFIQYQDRIIFGTDNGWGNGSPKEKIDFAIKNISFINNFLCSENVGSGYNNVPVQGFGLPGPVTKKILRENFINKKTPAPRPLNKAHIMPYAEDMLEKVLFTPQCPDHTIKRAKEVFQMLQNFSF